MALPLDGPAGWQPRFDGLSGALCALNSPSNPCAVLAADGVMEAAVAWAHATGTRLVHDIAYGFLGFERRVPSILEVPGAREVATELWSPSKIYGMAGWRVGSCSATRRSSAGSGRSSTTCSRASRWRSSGGCWWR